MAALRGSQHPYYAADGCYYAPGGAEFPHYEHESWDDFLAEMGTADLDMNLLYRWDWQIPDPSDYEYDDEPAPTTEHLALFYMQQRKARPVSHRIVVTPEDEQRIAEWLAVRAERLRLLWAPLLAADQAEAVP
jgi:hypothetical protein